MSSIRRNASFQGSTHGSHGSSEEELGYLAHQRNSLYSPRLSQMMEGGLVGINEYTSPTKTKTQINYNNNNLEDCYDQGSQADPEDYLTSNFDNLSVMDQESTVYNARAPAGGHRGSTASPSRPGAGSPKKSGSGLSRSHSDVSSRYSVSSYTPRHIAGGDNFILKPRITGGTNRSQTPSGLQSGVARLINIKRGARPVSSGNDPGTNQYAKAATHVIRAVPHFTAYRDLEERNKVQFPKNQVFNLRELTVHKPQKHLGIPDESGHLPGHSQYAGPGKNSPRLQSLDESADSSFEMTPEESPEESPEGSVSSRNYSNSHVASPRGEGGDTLQQQYMDKMARLLKSPAPEQVYLNHRGRFVSKSPVNPQHALSKLSTNNKQSEDSPTSPTVTTGYGSADTPFRSPRQEDFYDESGQEVDDVDESGVFDNGSSVMSPTETETDNDEDNGVSRYDNAKTPTPGTAGNSGVQCGNTAPQYGNTAPQYGNTAPQYGNTAPQYRNTAPQYGNTAPQYGNIAPQYRNNIPQAWNAAPQYGVNVPQIGNTPQLGNTVPQLGITAPHGNMGGHGDGGHNVSNRVNYFGSPHTGNVQGYSATTNSNQNTSNLPDMGHGDGEEYSANKNSIRNQKQFNYDAKPNVIYDSRQGGDINTENQYEDSTIRTDLMHGHQLGNTGNQNKPGYDNSGSGLGETPLRKKWGNETDLRGALVQYKSESSPMDHSSDLEDSTLLYNKGGIQNYINRTEAVANSPVYSRTGSGIGANARVEQGYHVGSTDSSDNGPEFKVNHNRQVVSDQSGYKVVRMSNVGHESVKSHNDYAVTRSSVSQDKVTADKSHSDYTSAGVGGNRGRSNTPSVATSQPTRAVSPQKVVQYEHSHNPRTEHTSRQNKLDEALMSSGRVSDAMASLLEWLNKAEAYLAEDQPILGDLDTVNILIEQHKAFEQELESRQSMVETMKESAEIDPSIISQIEELTHVWDKVNTLSSVRESRLQDAFKIAEEFNETVQIVREWLPNVEAELKFRPLPDDEDQIIQLIENHERFTEDLQSQQPNIERIRELAEEILQSCHPNAVRFVRYYLTITHTRWEQALSRSGQRAVRLQEALAGIRGNAALLEEILAWLTEAHALVQTKERDPIPEDLTVVDALVKEHSEFHEDLSEKSRDVEKLTTVGSSQRDHKVMHGSSTRLNEEDRPSPRVHALQNKWRVVWRMSVDRKKKLQDCLDHLLELESFKNFDFEMWRVRYITWIRAKKFRITDFFRRQDKDGNGVLSHSQFVDGMLNSKFPTNRTELHAVFDIFDVNRSGELDYLEFVAALRPERQSNRRMSSTNKPMTDAQLIHDEIEQQASHCQCRNAYKVHKMSEGKYKFGEKQKLYLVRFLNSTVMVRVGGGWQCLAEFLDNNDPCRAKGRFNTELREGFILPEGASQTRALFTPKRRPTTPSSGQNGNRSASDSSSPGALNSHRLSGSSSSLASSGRRTPSAGIYDRNNSRSLQNLSAGLSQARTPTTVNRRGSFNAPASTPLSPLSLIGADTSSLSDSVFSGPATPTTPYSLGSRTDSVFSLPPDSPPSTPSPGAMQRLYRTALQCREKTKERSPALRSLSVPDYNSGKKQGSKHDRKSSVERHHSYSHDNLKKKNRFNPNNMLSSYAGPNELRRVSSNSITSVNSVKTSSRSGLGSPTGKSLQDAALLFTPKKRVPSSTGKTHRRSDSSEKSSPGQKKSEASNNDTSPDIPPPSSPGQKKSEASSNDTSPDIPPPSSPGQKKSEASNTDTSPDIPPPSSPSQKKSIASSNNTSPDIPPANSTTNKSRKYVKTSVTNSAKPRNTHKSKEIKLPTSPLPDNSLKTRNKSCVKSNLTEKSSPEESSPAVKLVKHSLNTSTSENDQTGTLPLHSNHTPNEIDLSNIEGDMVNNIEMKLDCENQDGESDPNNIENDMDSDSIDGDTVLNNIDAKNIESDLDLGNIDAEKSEICPVLDLDIPDKPLKLDIAQARRPPMHTQRSTASVSPTSPSLRKPPSYLSSTLSSQRKSEPTGPSTCRKSSTTLTSPIISTRDKGQPKTRRQSCDSFNDNDPALVNNPARKISESDNMSLVASEADNQEDMSASSSSLGRYHTPFGLLLSPPPDFSVSNAPEPSGLYNNDFLFERSRLRRTSSLHSTPDTSGSCSSLNANTALSNNIVPFHRNRNALGNSVTASLGRPLRRSASLHCSHSNAHSNHTKYSTVHRYTSGHKLSNPSSNQGEFTTKAASSVDLNAKVSINETSNIIRQQIIGSVNNVSLTSTPRRATTPTTPRTPARNGSRPTTPMNGRTTPTNGRVTPGARSGARTPVGTSRAKSPGPGGMKTPGSSGKSSGRTTPSDNRRQFMRF